MAFSGPKPTVRVGHATPVGHCYTVSVCGYPCRPLDPRRDVFSGSAGGPRTERSWSDDQSSYGFGELELANALLEVAPARPFDLAASLLQLLTAGFVRNARITCADVWLYPEVTAATAD
jgi:hypothetical protein